MSENGLDFEVDFNPDFESMGYEMAGVIEFYEHPDTGEGAFKAMLYKTSQEVNLESDEDHTNGQLMVLIAQELLEEYLNREVH